jgi:hypothetical protein
MPALAPVIPLRPENQASQAPPDRADATEPAQLYDRIVFVLVLHTHGDVVASQQASPDYGPCVQCGLRWPCPPALLAWQLREGF